MALSKNNIRNLNKTAAAIVVLFFCALISNVSFAQYNSGVGNLIPTLKGHHWRKTALKPKVLLVQLRSEKSRIDYFEKNKKPYKAKKVKREASIIWKVMKNDFEENFSFCPVYYFIDTNAELVKKQLFDGVLFTAEGIPMSRNIVSPGDTDYFIVYYGYPEEQMDLDAMPEEYNTLDMGNGEVMGKGLIFLNYKYRQVDFYYRFAYYDLFVSPDHRYSYKSAEFDMEYYPFAAEYEESLQEKYNGLMVNKKLPRRY